MYYIIYEVKNKINGKSYIGKHKTDNIYDDYLGSGKYLKRALKKYGPECFEKMVLFVFDNKIDMDKKEAELVNDEFLKSGNTYNLKLGGEGSFDHLNTGSPEHIERCVQAGKKGYEVSVQTLKSLYGDDYKKRYKETYENGLLKYLKSDDPEIKKQRSHASSKSFQGKHHTEETKRKIGEANSIKQQGVNNSNYGNCWVYSLEEKRNKTIKGNELNFYLSNGWIKGMKMEYFNKK